MNSQIVKGSIADVAQRKGQSIATTFMQAKVVIILDVSGSMDATDAQDGLSRREVARRELEKLQNEMPGEIALICFASQVEFSPSGFPVSVGYSTNLTSALNYVKIADGTDVRFIVISDGEPDSKSSALDVAKTFVNRIDTIFVGSTQYDRGRKFLEELARVSGGKHQTFEKCKELSSGIIGLLKSGE